MEPEPRGCTSAAQRDADPPVTEHPKPVGSARENKPQAQTTTNSPDFSSEELKGLWFPEILAGEGFCRGKHHPEEASARPRHSWSRGGQSWGSLGVKNPIFNEFITKKWEKKKHICDQNTFLTKNPTGFSLSAPHFPRVSSQNKPSRAPGQFPELKKGPEKVPAVRLSTLFIVVPCKLWV